MKSILSKICSCCLSKILKSKLELHYGTTFYEDFDFKKKEKSITLNNISWSTVEAFLDKENIKYDPTSVFDPDEYLNYIVILEEYNVNIVGNHASGKVLIESYA